MAHTILKDRGLFYVFGSEYDHVVKVIKNISTAAGEGKKRIK